MVRGAVIFGFWEAGGESWAVVLWNFLAVTSANAYFAGIGCLRAMLGLWEWSLRLLGCLQVSVHRKLADDFWRTIREEDGSIAFRLLIRLIGGAYCASMAPRTYEVRLRGVCF